MSETKVPAKPLPTGIGGETVRLAETHFRQLYRVDDLITGYPQALRALSSSLEYEVVAPPIEKTARECLERLCFFLDKVRSDPFSRKFECDWGKQALRWRKMACLWKVVQDLLKNDRFDEWTVMDFDSMCETAANCFFDINEATGTRQDEFQIRVLYWEEATRPQVELRPVTFVESVTEVRHFGEDGSVDLSMPKTEANLIATVRSEIKFRSEWERFKAAAQRVKDQAVHLRHSGHCTWHSVVNTSGTWIREVKDLFNEEEVQRTNQWFEGLWKTKDLTLFHEKNSEPTLRINSQRGRRPRGKIRWRQFLFSKRKGQKARSKLGTVRWRPEAPVSEEKT
jgi:hypothetical protein